MLSVPIALDDLALIGCRLFKINSLNDARELMSNIMRPRGICLPNQFARDCAGSFGEGA